MRRRYTMVCLLFGAVILLAAMCYGSYQYAEKVAEERWEHTEEKQAQVEQTGGGTRQRTGSDTKYIVEIYNKDSEESVREERTMPSEYAGMTREELEDYLKENLEEKKLEEEEEGLTGMELVSFSAEELVIRKIYQEETGYILRLVDGEIAVFIKGKEDQYEKTGISQEVLSQAEVRALQEGYSVESEKDLYSILENFSS